MTRHRVMRGYSLWLGFREEYGKRCRFGGHSNFPMIFFKGSVGFLGNFLIFMKRARWGIRNDD